LGAHDVILLSDSSIQSSIVVADASSRCNHHAKYIRPLSGAIQQSV